MKLIALDKGQFTEVSDEWFAFLSKWKWFAWWNRSSKSYYASRSGSRVSGEDRTIWMHRVILGLSAKDKILADHKDRNTLNNQADNLRFATRQQNQINREQRRDKTSGFIGVERHGRGYSATCKNFGKKYYLGTFDTKEEAAKVRDEKAIELHGEFAVLNFPR